MIDPQYFFRFLIREALKFFLLIYVVAVHGEHMLATICLSFPKDKSNSKFPFYRRNTCVTI